MTSTAAASQRNYSSRIYIDVSGSHCYIPQKSGITLSVYVRQTGPQNTREQHGRLYKVRRL